MFLLAQLLEALKQPCGVVGTLGAGRLGQLKASINTTPDAISIQRILREWSDGGAAWAAMEVSSHGLHQRRVADLKFAAAVFTNLTEDHLDYHGDMQAYGEAKARLFAWPGLPVAVINVDDPFGLRLVGRKRNSATRIIRYSLDGAEAEFSMRSLNMGSRGFSALLCTPEGEFEIRCPLLGRFNAENVLAALATLYGCGFAVSDLVSFVSALEPVPGRMQCLSSADGVMAVIDYAHTPDALEKVLDSCRLHIRGRLICVFGCGGDRDRSKRPKMGAVASRLADHVVLTNDNPRSEDPSKIIADIASAASAARIEIDRELAIGLAIEMAEPGDLVLIAGKGHEDYQEFADGRRPFSDASVVRTALAARRPA